MKQLIEIKESLLKKIVYEAITQELNEGAWGTETHENDSVLDLFGEWCNKVVDITKDMLAGPIKDTNQAWYRLGLLDMIFKMFLKFSRGESDIIDKNGNLIPKNGGSLYELDDSGLIELATEYLEQVEKDNKWIGFWDTDSQPQLRKEFDIIRKRLELYKNAIDNF